MSLSKPIVIDPQSNSGSITLSKGVQIGLLIGIPVAVAAGLYWWSASGSPVKKADKSLSASGTPVKEKSIHVQLKEKGNECFKKGDYANALEFYGKAAELDPPNQELAALYQNRAAVFEKLGDYVQVIREATAALTLNQKYVKALSRRSKAYRLTGFLDEALEDITAVCVLESFSNTSSIQTADEILKEIGSSEAAKLIKLKKPSIPSDHSVEAFMRAFYTDPVSRWWKEKTDLSNGDVQGDVPEVKNGFLAALAALKAGNYKDIIELCTEEINNPDSKYKDEAYLLRGTFKYLWGYGDEVRDDLNQVIESKTAGADFKTSALIKMGSHYAMQHNEEKCFECFAKAEQLQPENVDIYHQRGQCLLTKGDYEGAATQVDKAYSLCPDFALAAGSKWFLEFRVANATENIVAVNEAVKQFQKCLRQFSTSPDIFNLYGQIMLQLGQFSEADVQFDKVRELDPKNAAVYVHKAMAQFQVHNNVEKTLKILRDAVKVDNKNEFVWETIGTLELQAGNLDASLEAITRALELAKSSQELMMLSSLKKAAEVQSRVKAKYNIEVPPVVQLQT